MKRLVLGSLCLGAVGVFVAACSAGNTPPGNGTPVTSGGATSQGGSTGDSGSTTVTSGGATSGGATATTGGSTGTTSSGGASTGGTTSTTKGGSTGLGGTMGSSGPPPAIGGFAVTIPPGALTMTDPTCGVQAFKRERKPTEIIMVLDRSASMDDPPESGGNVSKWNMVKPAITGSITSTNAALSWGLKLYPEGKDTGACKDVSIVPLIHVPIAANNAATVVAAINATLPEGDGTPTGDAIKFATDHLKSRANDNPKFILLATDGDPSCPSGDAAVTYAVTNIAAALTAGYPTFVVGVDTSKDSSVERLNLMAAAGGRPRPITATNPTAFYLATTQAELTSALQEITGAVASCVFELNPPPPVPDNIAVDFNGMRAPHDPAKMNGWEYTNPEHTSLEVFGAFCDAIKKQASNQVDIKYGCPGVPIPLPG